MAAKSPEDRALISQIAAAERWGRTTDRSAATAPARAGLRARFAKEVDPDCTLDQAERERRVDSLMRAHMLRMSLAAKTARRRAREESEKADQAEAKLAKATGGDAA